MSRCVAVEASEHQNLQLGLGRPHEKLASLYTFAEEGFPVTVQGAQNVCNFARPARQSPGNMRYLVAGYPAGGIFRPAIRTRLL
jgi:hypothetical protein